MLDDLNSTLSGDTRVSVRLDAVVADVATIRGSDNMPNIDSHNISESFEGEMEQDVVGVTRDIPATVYLGRVVPWRTHQSDMTIVCLPV